MYTVQVDNIIYRTRYREMKSIQWTLSSVWTNACKIMFLLNITQPFRAYDNFVGTVKNAVTLYMCFVFNTRNHSCSLHILYISLCSWFSAPVLRDSIQKFIAWLVNFTVNFTWKTNIALIMKQWVRYRVFRWTLPWSSLVRQWIFL